MSSTLYNMLGSNTPNMANSNLTQLISQFNTFKNNFQGDPKAQVQALLQSGQMSQEQFAQCSQMANQLRSLMGK